MVIYKYFLSSKGHMRDTNYPADMYYSIICPIYIPSFMKIGSVVSEELR